MKETARFDSVLIIISIALVLTVSAFAAGMIVYPYGILVLTLLFIARLGHIKSKR